MTTPPKGAGMPERVWLVPLDGTYIEQNPGDDYGLVPYVPASRLAALEADQAALVKVVAEIARGDGVFYLTQEAAFAPGISGEWPDVILAPHTPHGRLVKRTLDTTVARADYDRDHGGKDA